MKIGHGFFPTTSSKCKIWIILVGLWAWSEMKNNGSNGLSENWKSGWLALRYICFWTPPIPPICLKTPKCAIFSTFWESHLKHTPKVGVHRENLLIGNTYTNMLVSDSVQIMYEYCTNTEMAILSYYNERKDLWKHQTVFYLLLLNSKSQILF